MKNTKRSILCLSVLSALILTGCNKSGKDLAPAGWDDGVVWTSAGETEYNKLSDLKRGSTYRAYETYLPSSFNTAVTMQQSDGQIITNLVDGLVDVNRYGRIIPDLAESWTTNEDSSQYVFKIRDGVVWSRNDGNPYTINGETVYVKAQDWVKALKENLTYANGSDSSYLPMMFIEGAEEYYYYTYYNYMKAIGGGVLTAESLASSKPTDAAALETWTTCSAYSGKMVNPNHKCRPYARDITDSDVAGLLGVNESELTDVSNFTRVGVKASADGKTLTFDLNGSMPYFLSALTYTPFLPLQAEFYDSVGTEMYGTSRDTFLSNGAFLLTYYTGSTGTQLVLSKNMNYWDKENVKLGRVELYALSQDTTASTGRDGFESGTVDGFTVNTLDTTGWKKYVTGSDDTGTRENPANPDAYSNEGIGDGSTFGFALNIERDPQQTSVTVDGSIFSNYPEDKSLNLEATDSDGNNIALMNTNKALKLKSVRKLLMSSLDYPTYTLSYGNNVYDQTKYLVNTYTPHDFYIVSGDNDRVDSGDYNSYIKGAYIDKFLDGDRTSSANWAAADKKLGYSHFGGIGIATKAVSEQTAADKAAYEAEYKKLYDEAAAEIAQYNSEHASSPITLPIIVEYTGLAYNSDSDDFDRAFVNQTNADMNGCWVPGDNAEVSYGRESNANVCPAVADQTSGYGNKELVRLVKNTRTNIPTSDEYAKLTQYAGTSLFVTGWGPDYSDPLTFANTVTKDGDLCDYFGVCSNSNPVINDQIDSVIGKYTKLVETASGITNQVERAEAFAEAEVELLYNTYIMRPLYMRGQGLSVSVSRTVPYRVANVSYGLSPYKYKSVEKLADGKMLSQEQRKALKAEYDRLRVEDLAKAN